MCQEQNQGRQSWDGGNYTGRMVASLDLHAFESCYVA